jgi:hypothetical protein
MLTNENVQSRKKSARLPEGMSRPKTRPEGAKTVLSFQVDPDLLASLDEEADLLTRERGEGASKVYRSEAVKMAIAAWLKMRKADRTKRPQ